MLEYSKMILEKVNFDKNLFEKELKKALKTLSNEEQMHLRQWCLKRFPTKATLLV